MTAIAEELETFLREADPDSARRVERGVRRILARKRRQKAPAPPVPAIVEEYRLPTFSMGLNPEIDQTRIARFEEDDDFVV